MARSRSTRRFWLAGTLAAASLLLTGCSGDDLPRFGWPQGVGPQARAMQHFWSWTFIAALIVGIGVWGLMFWTFAFHRKKKNSPLYPKQTKENLPLELVYTAVPFLMVAVLFYFNVTTENFVLKTVANPDVKVNVTASSGAGTSAMTARSRRTIPRRRCIRSAPPPRCPSWCCRRRSWCSTR